MVIDRVDIGLRIYIKTKCIGYSATKNYLLTRKIHKLPLKTVLFIEPVKYLTPIWLAYTSLLIGNFGW